MYSIYEFGHSMFKRDNTGNVREWRAEVGKCMITSIPGFAWRAISGMKDGKMVTSGWKKVEEKNVGRANATTQKEQAYFEMNAEYQKKRDGGYFDDESKIDTFDKFKPMLAADYKKVKYTFPVIAQPKLDGIRCVAKRDGLWTRAGKPITSCPHIREALLPFFEDNPNTILDGELYNHELRDNFNKITSLVRKAKPTAEELDETKTMVQYHTYDCYTQASDPLEQRLSLLEHWFTMNSRDSVQVVVSLKIATQDELDKLFISQLEQGFEGQMVRKIESLYETNKRSKSLLKRKDFATDEFEVLAVLEGKGNWAGCAKMITVRLPDGSTCDAGCRGTMEEMRELLNGKKPDWATVRYFGYTPDNKLRFGVMIDHGNGIRVD